MVVASVTKAGRILVANPAAVREGLTLTEANVAIYVDRTFTLVDYLQSKIRIHRISQLRPCDIVLLLADETINSFIDYSLEQKHRLAQFAQSDVDTVFPFGLGLEQARRASCTVVSQRLNPASKSILGDHRSSRWAWTKRIVVACPASLG